MRLEMASFGVKDIQFSDRTRLQEGILHVDREELHRLLMEGGEFEEVALEIVRPGDDVRLIHVMDAVEPRFKPGEGSTFPTFVGPLKTVGNGRTHRLEGVALVSAGEPVAGEPTHWREAIIEMSGPAARATAFGSTVNLVLDFKPGGEYLDASRPDAVLRNLMVGSALAERYNRAVRVAELKAAAYLARTTADLEPDDLQVYELAPADPSLPRVVYFFQVGGMHAYGENVEKGHNVFPILLHPNEVLDGALINTLSNVNGYHRHPTFLMQNHAIIRELYGRHGADLDFAGVIIYPRGPNDLVEKHMLAEQAAKMARMLGARGACSSYWGSGHPCVEFMFLCQKCEQAGIKTVQVLPEGMDTADGPGIVYFVPEAVAIISTGRAAETVGLPSVRRAIGGEEIFSVPGPAADSVEVPYRFLFACCTSTGYGRLSARQC